MTKYTHQTAPTQFLEANGIRFAYRRFGKANGVPLVFSQHYLGIQQGDLHGLKALITGATSGLGRAIAVQLARDGSDVTVHGRDAARGVQARNWIVADFIRVVDGHQCEGNRALRVFLRGRR